jgi:hypothetical protein
LALVGLADIGFKRRANPARAEVLLNKALEVTSDS